MKASLNFTKSDIAKLGFLILVLGLVTVFSKSIGDYVVDNYNSKVEFLANNTVDNSNFLRH